MPEAEFEKTFADLAHARLRDRAPGLLDHLVGFQLLDKSEDDTYAIGVWGFKAGAEWLYNPVFFLNGQLKGDELLYIKSQDAFVPMTEKWVNYILNRRPHVLGESEPLKQNELGMQQPNFDALTRPPYAGSKMSSAGGLRSFIDTMTDRVGADFRGFMPVVVGSPRDAKYAALDQRWSLPAFLKSAGKDAAVALFGAMKKDAAFTDALLRFYDINDLVKAAESAIMTSALVKRAADGDKMIQGTAPKVRIIYADRADPMNLEATNLTDSEKEKLQRDRYLVKDRRGNSEVGTVYHKQIAKTLQSPNSSGYCRVITLTGGMVPHLVILNPVGDQGYFSDSGTAVVINMEKGNRLKMIPQRNIYTDAEPHDAATWKKKFDALPEAGSGREKDKVVFVNERLAGTVPFFIARKVTNDKGQVTYYGSFDRYPQSSGGDNWNNRLLNPEFHGRRFNVSDAGHHSWAVEPCGSCGADTSFVVTGKDGQQVTQIGNTYFVPNGFKFIRIHEQDITRWKLEDYARDQKSTTINGITIPPSKKDDDDLASPKTLADIEMQLFKSGMLTEIQPITDGIEFWIRTNGEMGRPMSKIAALTRLIMTHQLRESTASSMLKQARKNGAPSYRIKHAADGQPYSAPAIPEPMLASDASVGNGVPTQYPMNELIPIGSSAESSRTPQDMDATYRARARQASEQGQKEVMDTSVISGLVKTMNVDTVVDGYIGDLMLGLDRVGRILFMFYWHWDKFKERYGQQDMPELEDNLKNVFESLGDLVIFLKQKTIEPDVSGTEAETDLDQVN